MLWSSPWSESPTTEVGTMFVSIVEKLLPRRARQSDMLRSISICLILALFVERTSRPETLLATTTPRSIQMKFCPPGQLAEYEYEYLWNTPWTLVCIFNNTIVWLEEHLKLSPNIYTFLLDFASLLESMIQRGLNGSFECTSCGKTSGDRKSMRRHVETHMDVSHSCQLCDKVSKTRVGLAQHYSKYHGSEVVSPWAMSWRIWYGYGEVHCFLLFDLCSSFWVYIRLGLIENYRSVKIPKKEMVK